MIIFRKDVPPEQRVAYALADCQKQIVELSTKLNVARARIAELEALLTWRPIAEAPKDGQEFWLHGQFTYYMPYREVGPTQVLGKWSAAWEAWITNGGQYFTATHYMPAPPAPEPPKEAQPK